MIKFYRWHILFTAFFLLLQPQFSNCGTDLNDQERKTDIYAMYYDYKQKFVEIQEIHPLVAMKLYEEGKILFVDIRTPAEMRVSKLPGALTKDEFVQEPTGFSDLIIVAYCTIGYRSGIFASDMRKRNIRVHNLVGGLLAWVHEGGKVYDAEGETKLIHVYGKKWDYAPKAYQSVMFGFLEKYLK